MLIAHVINDLNDLHRSGAENFLFRLCERQRGNTHHVISLGGLGMAARFAEIGVEVDALGLRSILDLPAAIARLTHRLRQLQPDIVQTWLYRADIVGGLAARLAGVPAVVWSIRHGNLATDTNRPLTLLTAKLCAWLSASIPDAILANSAHARSIHEHFGYRSRQFDVIPNGFDLERFRPDPATRQRIRAALGLSEDAFVFGMLGRYVHQKGFAYFVDAAGKLSRSWPSARFVMAGRNVDAQNVELMNAVERNGLADAAIPLGERSDVAELLAAFDALAFPSIEGEGFPNVLGEAMATGLPCITTDVSDCAAIVGNSGLVVPPRDADALAEAMARLIAMDGRDLAALGANARRRVLEKFELGEIVAQYAAFYDCLAASTRPSEITQSPLPAAPASHVPAIDTGGHDKAAV